MGQVLAVLVPSSSSPELSPNGPQLRTTTTMVSPAMMSGLRY